jgi:hypothetical protein
LGTLGTLDSLACRGRLAFVAADGKVSAAKEQMLERAARWPWLVGLGVGKIDEAIGLIASVKKGSGDAARRAIDRMQLAVPVRVREVSSIRARELTAGPRRRQTAATAVAAAGAPGRGRGGRVDTDRDLLRRMGRVRSSGQS